MHCQAKPGVLERGQVRAELRRYATRRTSCTATIVLFVMEGKVIHDRQDGADQKLVPPAIIRRCRRRGRGRRRSPTWVFGRGTGGCSFRVVSGKRAPVATTGQALDFTPAFSPEGKTLA